MTISIKDTVAYSQQAVKIFWISANLKKTALNLKKSGKEFCKQLFLGWKLPSSERSFKLNQQKNRTKVNYFIDVHYLN